MKDDTNTPPWDTFTKPTCQGLHPIGARCGWCERCEWEKEQKAIYATVEVQRKLLREVPWVLARAENALLEARYPVTAQECSDLIDKINALLGDG